MKHTTPKFISRARALRANQADAERRLWFQLRDERFPRYKFRRQHPIGWYIVDFVCLEAHVVIELDGSQHMDPVAYDKMRTDYLESEGFNVLRLWDGEVLREMSGVLEVILRACEEGCAPHPSPLPAGGARGRSIQPR